MKINVKTILLGLSLLAISAGTVRAQQTTDQAAPPTAEQNKSFLESNKSKPGVVVLPSGLQYKIVTTGTGAKPADTCKVTVNFSMQLVNGKTIYSTFENGQVWNHHIAHALKAWQQALPLMPVGSKWMLYIPADLAFGDNGDGGQIAAGSTLICTLELVKIG
jgi:FKBP-type peptidyl-prolyl cis-trans isomerase FklB